MVNKRKRKNDDIGRIAAAVTATLVCIVLVAALCSSGAYVPPVKQDAAEEYVWTGDENALLNDSDIVFEGTANGDGIILPPSQPNDDTTVGGADETTGIPDETTGVGTTASDETGVDSETESHTTPPVSSDTQTDTQTTTAAKDTTTASQTTPPSSSGTSWREYYDDERFIGGYAKNGVILSISKVERGDLNYFICDIKLSSPLLLRTAFSSENRVTDTSFTSQIAKANNAVFAVNGDYCGFRKDGIIIRGGTLRRNDTKSDWDLCYLDANGDLQMCLNNTVDGNALVSQGVLQSWCFGPTLVRDGKAVTNFNTPGLSRSAKEPRTAIGQVDKLHYIILVVDQVRKPEETGGMSFSELAAEFERLGCQKAYNLDGGGSTTLYFNGQVINKPCVEGERKISDIIYLK